MRLVIGAPNLHDTVAGLELQLPPVKNLWNTIHGAEMLCQALEELLAPSEKTTVLDIGCGIGLLGLYLSKVCVACSIFLFFLFLSFFLSFPFFPFYTCFSSFPFRCLTSTRSFVSFQSQTITCTYHAVS